jgi:carbohydrate diacid regulator
MAILTGSFDNTAETLSDNLAELLGVHVSIVDLSGKMIVESEPSLPASAVNHASAAPQSLNNNLRIPLSLNGCDGEVIVNFPSGQQTDSSRLAQAIIELVIRQALMGNVLPDRNELKNKFIHDLLLDTTKDKATILRESQILGMDLTRPRAVILVNAADYILACEEDRPGMSEACIQQRAQYVINTIVHFFHLPDETICAYIGNGEIAILKASSSQDLVAWADNQETDNLDKLSWANLKALKRATTGLLTRLFQDTGVSMSIGIGRYHPGIAGLPRSYQDARAALSLGLRFQVEPRSYCLDELGIAAFVGLSDEQTKFDLARHLLSPLDHETELLETLDCFFAQNCSPSATARQLCIHRNTLSYRLDKITSFTGLDPRNFEDAMQIRLARLLHY